MKLILLVFGMILLCGSANADIGYTEINLIDYKTNNFIYVNSSIPLSEYTINLTPGINWVGMPYGTGINDADELINSIPNMTRGNNVKAWNTTSQSYMVLTYIYPTLNRGNNFLVKPYMGYEIAIGTAAVWTIDCLLPVNPILQYQCFNLNKYIGTNIIRVRNI